MQLEGRRRGEVLDQHRALPEDRPDVVREAAAIAPRDEAEHLGLAGGGVEDAGQDADRGRLARPVGPDVGDPLTARDIEIELVEGQDRAPLAGREQARATRRDGELTAQPAGTDGRGGRIRGAEQPARSAGVVTHHHYL